MLQPSIYEAIGGEPAVRAAVDRFYERVWSDPDLVGWFAEIDPYRLKDHQRAFISAALGGPDGYAGRSMAEAHRGRAITDAAFDRVVEHLADALADLGVSEATIGTIAGALAPLRGDVVEQPTAPVG
jgi:hemoglobin